MAPELAFAARGIPLHAHDGTIRAFAVVDAENHEHFSRVPWFCKISRGLPYAARSDNRARRTIFLHREILGLGPGDLQRTDHINRNSLDCRRANLRAVTHAQNHQNRAKGGDRQTTSRFRGVCYLRASRKWRAYAQLDGVLHYLGDHKTEQEAAEVAATFRARHMPFSTN
jgi:hypothetical protein